MLPFWGLPRDGGSGPQTCIPIRRSLFAFVFRKLGAWQLRGALRSARPRMDAPSAYHPPQSAARACVTTCAALRRPLTACCDALDSAAAKRPGRRFALEAALAEALAGVSDAPLSREERAVACYVLAEARALPETREERDARRRAEEKSPPLSLSTPFAPLLTALACARETERAERRFLATLLIPERARKLHALTAAEAISKHGSAELKVPQAAALAAVTPDELQRQAATLRAAARNETPRASIFTDAAAMRAMGSAPSTPRQGESAQQQHLSAFAPGGAPPGELTAEQQRRGEAMAAALRQGEKEALPPPAQAALVRDMKDEPALARRSAPTQPAQLLGIVEANPVVAVEVLALMMPTPVAEGALRALAASPVTLHSLEVVNRLAMLEAPARLPDDFVRAFASRCVGACGEAGDSGKARVLERLVRMVCVLLQGLLGSGSGRFDAAHLAEMEAFAAEHSRVREAADLYRTLCELRS